MSEATQIKLDWQRIDANAEGSRLPWPTASTEAKPIIDLIPSHGSGLFWLDPVFAEAYRDVFGAPDDDLMWTGLTARDAIREATFGDRRKTFAVPEAQLGEVHGNPANFAMYQYRTELRSPDEIPAMAALRASVFEPSREYGSEYWLRPEIPSFDVAVAGLLIVSGGRDV